MASANAAAELAERLGHRFADPALLEQALTHPSAAGARGAAVGSYERLEFLGDRVLGLIVADLLLDAFPREPEGALARRHAYLVSRDALAEVARGLGLGADLRMSKGEAESGGRDNPAMLADVCEAVIGAIYRDAGYAAAWDVVTPLWTPLLHLDRKPPQDAKTALQEWAQARGLPLPSYSERARSGPPHEPRFTVAVSLTGYADMTGEGRSKRLAEQTAAQRMLDHVRADGGDEDGDATE